MTSDYLASFILILKKFGNVLNNLGNIFCTTDIAKYRVKDNRFYGDIYYAKIIFIRWKSG